MTLLRKSRTQSKRIALSLKVLVVLSADCDRRNLLMTSSSVVRITPVAYDAKVKEQADELFIAVTIFLLSASLYFSKRGAY